MDELYQVDITFVKPFLERKLRYNALNACVRLANAYGLSSSEIDHLITAKQRSKQEYMADEGRLLRMLPWDTNLGKLADGWYVVRYRGDKGDPAIKIDILAGDVSLLEKKGIEKDYSRVEIETIIPAYIDEPALAKYKQEIHDEAIKVLVEECPTAEIPEIEKAPCNARLTVSSHAGKRWVQRRMGITADFDAENYRKAHINEVTSAVVEGCEGASILWEADDGVQYRFDNNNIVYLVGNNNVITLYEEDFGFAKSINRAIVLDQIEIIKDRDQRLREAEIEHAKVVKEVDNRVLSLDSELDVLTARANLLKAERVAAIANKDVSSKLVKVHRQTFDDEFRKLFKRWEAKSHE